MHTNHTAATRLRHTRNVGPLTFGWEPFSLHATVGAYSHSTLRFTAFFGGEALLEEYSRAEGELLTEFIVLEGALQQLYRVDHLALQHLQYMLVLVGVRMKDLEKKSLQ